MSACFLVNGIIFGIINTFGILFVELKKEMVANGVEDASAKCSLVGNNTNKIPFNEIKLKWAASPSNKIIE